MRNLDISTGPILAPSLAFAPLLEVLQLSDFGETNRRLLRDMDIFYWENYAREVLILEGQDPTEALVQERLRLLDGLRKTHVPVMVDIKQKPILFDPFVDTTQFNLFSMHFVADSITGTKNEYFELLAKVLGLLKKGDILAMSSLIECTRWDNGKNVFPSPNLKMVEISDFLIRNALRLLRDDVFIPDKPQGQDGGIGVTLAIKE